MSSQLQEQMEMQSSVVAACLGCTRNAVVSWVPFSKMRPMPGQCMAD